MPTTKKQKKTRASKSTKRLARAIAPDVKKSRGEKKTEPPMTPMRKQAIAEVEARIERLEGDKPAKPARKPREKKPDAPKRLSALDAAHQVLAKSDEPLGVPVLIERMAKEGLWTSPGGKTPGATLNAAIIREIATKGEDARFKKIDRGLFVARDIARADAA
jgi:hypothetical protein